MRKTNPAGFEIITGVVFMAMELSDKKWKLAFSDGQRMRPSIRSINYGALDLLAQEILDAKQKFMLPEDAAVFACYEAGRDGFWLHRELTKMRVKSHVVDSASIKVSRHARQRKTDRLDAQELMVLLRHYFMGEKDALRVCRVPTFHEEDLRHLNRELDELKVERTRLTNRMKSLLVTHGVKLKSLRGFEVFLEEVVLPSGELLPKHLSLRLMHEHQRYELLQQQIGEVESVQNRMKKAPQEHEAAQMMKVNMLEKCKGIGPVTSWVLVTELFGWRTFRNVKEVGGATGLIPTPWASGNMEREQGISKAANKRVRKLLIELAWSWVRYQPTSALTLWYVERFADNGKRARKRGIVAVARRLAIALWRYLEQGKVPEGAVLKAA